MRKQPLFCLLLIRTKATKNRNLHQLCKSLDIKSFKVNDYDISKFYKLSKELINYVRKYNRPALIEVNTYRFLEHCGPIMMIIYYIDQKKK